MSKYREPIIRKILNYIRQGVPVKYAAPNGGLSETQIYHWINTKPEFAKLVEQARAEAVKNHVLRINRASVRNPNYSTWWLEHQAKDEFAPYQQIDKKEQINVNITTTGYLPDIKETIEADIVSHNGLLTTSSKKKIK